MLQYSIAVGTEAERLAALQKKIGHLHHQPENVQWLVSESGIPLISTWWWSMSCPLSRTTRQKRFRALMKALLKVKRIVGLTGTPSSNGLMDLWAEFRLLDMGERLGKFIGQYRTQYFLPDKRNGQVVFSYKPLLPGAEEKYMAKFLTSRFP